MLSLSGLYRIHEIWPLVASNPDLFGSHSLVHIVSSASPAKFIFSSQHAMHEDGASEETDDLICQDSSMASPVPGLFLHEIDVRANLGACQYLLYLLKS